MELRQQLDKWSEQLAAADEGAMADIDVAKRLLKHGIEALTEIDRLRETLQTVRLAASDYTVGTRASLEAVHKLVTNALKTPNVKLRGCRAFRQSRLNAGLGCELKQATENPTQ